jgi:type IV pilus assembly protein PilP
VVLALSLMILTTGGCFLEGLFGKGKKAEPPAPQPTASTKTPAKPGEAKKAEPPAEESPMTMEKLQQMYDAKAAKYVFDANQMVDPFQPITAVFAATTVEETPVVEGEPKGPLEKMDLAQVRLVAIVVAGENTRALVEDTAGLGYIISVGTKIGKNGGKVIQILPDTVEVEEPTKTLKGEKKTKVSSLKLPRTEGETK